MDVLAMIREGCGRSIWSVCEGFEVFERAESPVEDSVPTEGASAGTSANVKSSFVPSRLVPSPRRRARRSRMSTLVLDSALNWCEMGRIGVNWGESRQLGELGELG